MDKTWYPKVSEYVDAHRQELVDCVIRLVNVPSVKGEPAPDAPYGPGPKNALLEGLKICEEEGMAPFNHENICGSAVFTPKTSAGGKEIGFVAHLDVVPVGEGWMSDPFQGIERDGFIVGRGARDNKAGFAAALIAINAMRDLEVPLRHNLRLVMGCDEECGMSDMEWFAKNGPVPDFSIVTDCYFPVSHGEKGMVHGDIVIPVEADCALRIDGGTATNIIPDLATARLPLAGCDRAAVEALAAKRPEIEAKAEGDELVLTAHGVSAHASEPEKAKNAIKLLARFLLDAGLVAGKAKIAMEFALSVLDCDYGENFGLQHEDPESGKTTCIAGMIRTGQGELRLNINIRYSISDHHDRFLPLIEQTCAAAGCRFDLHEASAPYYIPGDRPEVVELTRIYQEISGDNRPQYVVAGGTYARKLPNAIAFGPGSQDETFPYPAGHGDAHQPDESQDIGYLMQAAKIYAMAIIELDRILD